jgi:hypothetical protein
MFSKSKGTEWPKGMRNTELWEPTGEKPVILQIETRKWRRIGHILRKRNEYIEKEALDWNPQGTRRRGN